MFFPYWVDAPVERLIIITPLLIFINIALFCLIWIQPVETQILLYENYALMPDHLFYGLSVADRFSALATHLFLHGDWLHLGINMLFLWAFGIMAENHLGALRFLILYLIGGIIGALVHVTLQPHSPPLIGASGAISAVMGVLAVSEPLARSRVLFLVWKVQMPVLVLMFIFIFFDTMEGLAQLGLSAVYEAGTAYWAHLGGFAAGALLFYPLKWLSLGERTSPYLDFS